jgi:peptidoglycan/xylan/chitin deacetylase (PgdA/CDA1 family)
VCLTFDFDAESIWLRKDRQSPSVLSRGIYGAKVGVPRILALLERYKIKGTFFAPGWTAEQHPHEVEAIHRAGHEVAHHGYLHQVKPVDMTPDEEWVNLERGTKALQAITGERPIGYRCPGGVISPETLGFLAKAGFVYDSSMMDDERPYLIRVPGHADRPLVELPGCFELDDAPYFMFTFSPTYMTGNSDPNKVLRIWQSEFRGIYREGGGMFMIMFHPQVIARHHRMEVLEELIRFIQGFPGVTFRRCDDVAREFLAQSAAG